MSCIEKKLICSLLGLSDSHKICQPTQLHYTRNEMSVYILNWKKVSTNSLALYENIKPIIPHTYIINCDETMTLPSTIQHVQLDDSYYYGGQFDSAIKHVAPGHLFCLIVGDNVSENNFETIFDSAICAFNNFRIGVYAPNDKRSVHTVTLKQIYGQLYDVVNTDCGFWFISPSIVHTLRIIDYHSATRLGWGIDRIFIKEARRRHLLVVRDYSIETDQLDHTTNYNQENAHNESLVLETIYEDLIKTL
jgi:hypothetical protein